MPDGGVSNLLLSMGLDLSPVKSAADTIKSTLDGLNSLADQVAATATGAAKAQSAEMKQLREQAQASVIAAKEAIAAENAKAAAIKTQTAELGRQKAEQQSVTAAAQAGIAAAKEKQATTVAETAELKRQTAELQRQAAVMRQQALEQRAASRTGETQGGTGLLGGLGGNVSKGLLGTGMAGGVAGGLLAGAGIAGLIMMAGGALESFLAKLREVTVESGKLTILEDVFKGLARGSGIGATEMMQKMSTATEGLVSKTTLLKAANTELRSPLHLTSDQIAQLMGNITKLSEAAGNTAEQGIQRLNMAFLRGRPMILSTVIGVQGLREVMRDIPSGMNAAARTTLEWQRALKMINDQAAKMGELPVTIEQMTTRLHVATQNVMLGFGMGFGESAGMQTFIKMIDALTGKLGGLEGVAKTVGNALGDFIGAATAQASIMYQNYKLLFGIVGDVLSTVKSLAEAVAGPLVTAFSSANTATDATIQEFTKTHEVLGPLISAWVTLSKAIASVLVPLRDLTGMLSTGVKVLTDQAKPEDFMERIAKLPGLTDEASAKIKQVFAVYQQHMKEAESARARIKEGFGKGDDASGLDDRIAATDAAEKEALSRFKRQMQQWIKDNHISPTDLMLGGDPVADTQRVKEQIDKSAQGFIDSYNKSTSAIKNALGKTIGGTTPNTGETPQQVQKDAQAVLQEKMAQDKLDLDRKKDTIAQRKALDDLAYKYEHESLAQHYQTMNEIAEDNHAAAIAKASNDFNAQKEALDARAKATVMTATQLNAARAKLQIEYDDKILAADRAFQLEQITLQGDHDKDMQEAQQKAIQGRLKAAQEEAAAELEALQHKFKSGGVDPQAYLRQQLAIIETEKQARIQAANDIFANSVDKDREAARLRAFAEADAEAKKKAQAAEDRQGQNAVQYVSGMVQPRQQAIQAQIGSLQPGQNPAELQKQMLALLDTERRMYEVEISRIPAAEKYGDTWNMIFQKIEQTYQMQQKYNNELRNSQNFMAPIADNLRSVSDLVSAIWDKSKFVSNLFSGLGPALQMADKLPQNSANIAGMFGGNSGVAKDPQMQALEDAAKSSANSLGNVQKSAGTLTGVMDGLTASASHAARALDNVGSHKDSSSSSSDAGAAGSGSGSDEPAGAPDSGSGMSFSAFSKGLSSAVDELTSFVSGIQKSKSAGGGALSGGVSGAEMGSQFGPLGMAIGAAVGATLGAIVGHKNAVLSSELSQLGSQYTSVMDGMKSNGDNLQEAIDQMHALVAEAEQMEANSKKGGSQFSSLISQYTEELSQLSDQQSSIIQDMETQLAIFSTPTGMQSYLSTLNQVIETYDKFAGAAANAMELAQANSWLTDSLSSYTTQMENTFVNDEESGIDDALQLNSLISERSTMISNLNDSIQNVLEQGVLTRQQTTAQTKGQQIEKLETQGTSQLQSINQEISLEQYKVSIETSLYNLAMTSMGLEAQLLSLQEGQASQSLAAIQALQTLINALQGGSYNFNTISGILSALGYTGVGIESGTISTVAGSLASTSGLDTLASAAYQSRATLGYASYRGANI